MFVYRCRAEAGDNLLHVAVRDRDAADGDRHLCSPVREKVVEWDEGREQPGGEEGEDEGLETEEPGRELGRDEDERGEEEEGDEREEAAHDRDHVSGVEYVVAVDVDGGTCGRDGRELFFLVVELDEGVDADAHAGDPKGKEEQQRQETRQP